MRKLFKFLLILLLFIVFFMNFNIVNATEEDVQDSDIEDVSNEDDVIVESSSKSNLSILAPSTGTSVTNLNSYEQANLKLNNILSIILIAIGILLILFSIAILIRIGK